MSAYIALTAMSGRRPNRGCPFRRGLSMVECMISLVIAAALLTATGIAFASTCKAMTTNDQFFRATQASRVSLTRILTQIRRGLVDEKSTYNNLHVITADNQDLTYSLVTTTDTAKAPMVLNMTRTDAAGVKTTYELACNVTTTIAAPTGSSAGSPFNVQLGTDSNNALCVSRVSVTLSVKIGPNEVRLSGSAAPRCNITY